MSEPHDPLVLPDAVLRGLLAGAPWRRVAVLGDSIAEGVREPVAGWRDASWIDRITAALPAAEVLNLGRRNLLAAQVREQQLEAALAFAPDLAIVSAGGNDTLRRTFDAAGVARELDAIAGPLRAAGADVVLLELMDIVRSGLVAPQYREAVDARQRALAEVTRAAAARHGALLVAMRGHPASADPELFASDRLHLNTRGHAVVGTEAVRTLARVTAMAA